MPNNSKTWYISSARGFRHRWSGRTLLLCAAALALGALALVFVLAPAIALGSHGGAWHTIERVSVSSASAEGDASSSSRPFLSADGRFVVFASEASNMVAGDTNGVADIFVRDRQTGATERVSISTAGAEADALSYQYPSLSADGRFVAFGSFASNLVAGDTNGAADVFVRDRQDHTTVRVSISTGGAEGNGYSYVPSLSADGNLVVFYSHASNLVAGDTNGTADVFVHDILAGTTGRVSVDSSGAEGTSGIAIGSTYPAISGNGRTVAFTSYATNLVTGDTNGTWDVFVAALQCQGTSNTIPLVTPDPPGRVLYAHRTWTLQVATFTDPDTGDTHAASINWGDGVVTPGTVNEATGTVTGSHRYLTPGTYTVGVTVSDNHGGSGEATFQVVVRPHPRLRR